MADVFGPGKRSEIMRCVRSEGNRATSPTSCSFQDMRYCRMATAHLSDWEAHFVFRRERIGSLRMAAFGTDVRYMANCLQTTLNIGALNWRET